MTADKCTRKVGGARDTCDPINFGALNANSSKMAKGTNFKFGRHTPRNSPGINLTNIFETWAWPGSCDPVNFWALNANSSKNG